jgi:hypothetical protein
VHRHMRVILSAIDMPFMCVPYHLGPSCAIDVRSSYQVASAIDLQSSLRTIVGVNIVLGLPKTDGRVIEDSCSRAETSGIYDATSILTL